MASSVIVNPAGKLYVVPERNLHFARNMRFKIKEMRRTVEDMKRNSTKFTNIHIETSDMETEIDRVERSVVSFLANSIGEDLPGMEAFTLFEIAKSLLEGGQ